MNDNEIKIFYEVLDVLNQKKSKHPKFFNNPKTKLLFKDERYISNDVTKGVIMFELNNEYIVDIFVDDGVNNLVNGLLNQKFNTFEDAKIEYDNSLKYLDISDLTTILLNGKEQLLSFD